MKNFKGLIILLALAIVFGFTVKWRDNVNAVLREEHIRLQASVREQTRLKAMNVQNRATAVASEDLSQLENAASEAAAINERIERLNAIEVGLRSKNGLAEVQTKKDELWRNLGQDTPSDILQSVIWASINGDVKTLRTMLAYDLESRMAAEKLLAALPEEARVEYPTVEKLIATMMAGRLPTDYTGVQIIEQTAESSDSVSARVRLQRAAPTEQTPRDVIFRFQRKGAEWRLTVPKSAIEGFRRSLGV
jgi:hypothetical protein